MRAFAFGPGWSLAEREARFVEFAHHLLVNRSGLIEAFHSFMDGGHSLAFICLACHVWPSRVTGRSRNLSPTIPEIPYRGERCLGTSNLDI